MFTKIMDNIFSFYMFNIIFHHTHDVHRRFNINKRL